MFAANAATAADDALTPRACHFFASMASFSAEITSSMTTSQLTAIDGASLFNWYSAEFQPAVDTLAPNKPDQELLELIQAIEVKPIPTELITPATERFSQEQVNAILAEGDPEFDVDKWNAEWDAHEAEMKRLAAKNEHKLIEDIVGLSAKYNKQIFTGSKS